ncbi:MAG: ABC-F family ATP-binding cassette domain-containing protein [Desulfobacteraceae bacterium]|jgi:ATP-binding cassette subfamily F protein 3|nr:ABC-F family ATP-binding cassette domain-containing protein [Desulfobacteraceae bacterium]
MIRIENLTKSFGDRLLLDEISFAVAAKQRIGLVGQNGHGKTTLFQMITGEEQPDSGSVVIPKNYRIVYVQQHLEFAADTALEEGMRALLPQEQGQAWKVERILAGLGFSEEDFHRHPSQFSGGLQVRLNLVKALVSEPDLLLLDEPTNFLDITSIRWIEQFLKTWPHELLLITHDRSFMDKVVTHTLGIHRRKIRKISGNTAKYYSQIAQDEEVYEKTRVNDERRRKEIQQFITRFRAKARLANMVQSRVKTLKKMEKKDKLEQMKLLDFSFRSSPFPGKRALTASNLNFAYEGGSNLIKDFNITIEAGERVCVVGKNGKGKTTLLKLLAGVLSPQAGETVYHPSIEKGFFEQTNINSLVDARTVEEEILYSHPDMDRQRARNICGAMMFTGDDALKKISVLSGGEKSRVMLGKLLATPVNLLLLDEPTNHLDMESCDALLTALDFFEGTVIMVTHNEMFLDALAERLIVFQNDHIDVFDGSYQDFLEKDGWHDKGQPAGSSASQLPGGETTVRLTKKEMRRKRSDIIAQRSKIAGPLERRIAGLENEIENHENELNRLNQAMQLASQQQDGEKIAELGRAIHANQSAIEKAFDELEKIAQELDRHNAAFEKQIQMLDAQQMTEDK